MLKGPRSIHSANFPGEKVPKPNCKSTSQQNSVPLLPWGNHEITSLMSKIAKTIANKTHFKWKKKKKNKTLRDPFQSHRLYVWTTKIQKYILMKSIWVSTKLLSLNPFSVWSNSALWYLKRLDRICCTDILWHKLWSWATKWKMTHCHSLLIFFFFWHFVNPLLELKPSRKRNTSLGSPTAPSNYV